MTSSSGRESEDRGRGVRPDLAVRDALGFLTVLPVGRRPGPPRASAGAAFPLAGLAVGLLWALAARYIESWQTAAIAAATVLIVDALVTGFLHLDALADVSDGVASRRRGDAAVAIMREPTVGAIGAAAVILVCLLRYALLTAAVVSSAWLVIVPVVGRTAMLWVLWRLPAREGSSLVHAFGSLRLGSVLVGLMSAVLIVVLVPPAALHGALALATALVFSEAYGFWWARRFGGLSGDGAGACGLLAETIALCALLPAYAGA